MRQLITLLLLAPLATFAQSPNWESKIDPKLREYASNPDSAVEFLVIMQEQADLSAAKQLKKKEEKEMLILKASRASTKKKLPISSKPCKIKAYPKKAPKKFTIS